MKGLGRQPDVPHHGNLRVDERFHHRRALAPAFQLHGLRTALLDEPNGRGQRLLNPGVIRAIGQIGHQQGPPRATAHRLQVMEHLLDGDRHRRIKPQDGLSKGVAHERHIDSRFVQQSRGGVVIRRKAGDLFPPELSFQKGRNGDFAHGLGIRVHGIAPLLG